MDMAKIIAKKNTGAQALRNPWEVKPSRLSRWPSWKMSRPTPNAAPSASRLVMTPIRATSGARKANSMSRKPSPSTTAITKGVYSPRAASRSWFSAAAPPTSTPAGNAVRRRSTVSPSAGSDGSTVGTARTSASPSAPACGGRAAAIPASAAATARASSIDAAGPTICSCPGAPGPNASVTTP